MADNTIGTIAEIWRYPVQSMAGETLSTTELTPAGVHGDRAWGLVDREVKAIVSSSQGKRKWRDIVTLGARYLRPPPSYGPASPVEIITPSGKTMRSDEPDIDRQLSAFLGGDAHLADKETEQPRTEYGYEPVHLLTTGSLQAFAAHHPQGQFAPARFRPNIVVDTGGAWGFIEQTWVGRRLRIGEAVEIAVTDNCKRCVMTTLAQGDLPLDPAILHTVTAHNKANAGVYATVARPGSIRVGDPIRVVG